MAGALSPMGSPAALGGRNNGTDFLISSKCREGLGFGDNA
jgi:hypothetical protein